MKYSTGCLMSRLLNSSPPKLAFAVLLLLVSKFSYACDPEAFNTTNSDKIIEEIYAQGELYGDCIGELFEIDADTAEIVFRTNTLLDVAEEARSLARNYNGGGNNNLRDLFYFLRGAYFVDAQHSSFSIDDSVFDASVTAIQTLVDSNYLYQTNSSHADLLYNAIVVIDSIGAHSEFYTLMKDWITNWDQDYQDIEDMDLVTSTFIYLLKRAISDYDFEEQVLLNDPTIVYALNDYLDNSWMLGTEMEATLAEGALLLGRLTALEWYGNANNIESHVDAALNDLFSRYSPTGNGKSLWGNAAGEVLWYGDCSKYDEDVCNFESAFVEPLLSDVYWCDDFLNNGSNTQIRAQDMTTNQARETCELLDDELSRFTDRFGNTVVKNDFSNTLEMIIFNSKTDYQIYSPSIFGNSTNNGGIYLEGEPSDPDNVARFITFEFDDSNNPGEFAIKNVEHEYVHYLDGRINRYGSFSTSAPSNGGNIVWWTEGLAEYVAWQDNSPYAPDAMVEGYYRLSEVFVTDYNDSIARIYDWGYAASRFMKECHSADVDIILENIRKGDYGAYRRYLEKIGDRYDDEFDNWTPGLAANEPSHITDNACDGSSTSSSNIDLVAETIQSGDSIPVNLGEAEETLFKVSVPDNNSAITASLSNENGDVDIYVLANEPAYQAGYDCKDDEICTVNIAGANEYYIMLRGYYDVNSANLNVSFDGSSPPPGDEIELTNGSEKNISASGGEQVKAFIEVPQGASNLVISINGDSGDADLYVNRGSYSDSGSADCFNNIGGSNETCDESKFGTTQADTYYIVVTGYNSSSFSNVTLSASYDGGTEPPPSPDEIELFNGSNIAISADAGEQIRGFISLPSGASNLVVSIQGDSGDADLYVNRGSYSDSSSADCFNNIGGSNETCDESHFGATVSDTYYIVVVGYNERSFSGVTLSASYDTSSNNPGDDFEVNVANGEYQHIQVEVPDGASSIEVNLDKNGGSAMLMINHGSQASARVYDARDTGGNQVILSNPTAGTWYIAVRGRNDGVDNGMLTVDIN